MKNLCMILFAISATFSLQANNLYFEYKNEGWTLGYKINDDNKTCSVIEPRGHTQNDLIIPPIAYDDNGVGYTVTAIADRAFSNYYYLFTSVKIPDTVISIGDYAFDGVATMTSIDIPESVTSIGEGAFRGCPISSINIPKRLKYIGNETFYETKLASVELPDSVKSIGTRAFARCRSLKEIKLNEKLCSIGDSAFYKCRELLEIEIPDLVREIGALTFDGCLNLKIVKIPDDLRSIGKQAFYDCRALSSIVIPEKVTKIEDYTFYNCRNLISAEIGHSVTSIGDYAFYGCSTLQSMEIPNSVISIGDYAFAGAELTSIKFGSSLISIGEYAFEYCKPQELIFPPSLEVIGKHAFGHCDEVKAIVLGPNIKYLGASCLYCKNVQDVYITAVTPPETDIYNSPFCICRTLYVLNQKAYEAYTQQDYVFRFGLFSEYKLMNTPTGIKTNYTAINGHAGDTFQLHSTLEPLDVSLPYIFWYSTNPDIADVDLDGVVVLKEDVTGSEVRSEDGQSCKIVGRSLYPDGPVAEVIVGVEDAGVEEMTDDGFGNYSKMEVFDLQGRRVSNSLDVVPSGIYIVRQGKVVRKIMVK